MKRSYYFDYASTTPLDERAFLKMKPYFANKFGNPSNLYEAGREAKWAIANALVIIGSVLGCRQDEFVFTGSATEADNLAIAGVARARQNFVSQNLGGQAAKNSGNKIIVSSFEHKGIMAVCEALAKVGFEIVELGADSRSFVDLKQLEKILDDKTILVSVGYADSETGTIQPIEKISGLIKKFRNKNKSALPYFHTDASQAAAYLDLGVDRLGVDLMTLSGHKLYGPKGIGGLYVRRGVNVKPIIYGGGQQGTLRSGTENVPGIVGFAGALSLVQSSRAKEYARIKKLRDRLERGIFCEITKVVLNGNKTERLPNFLNVSVLDIEGEAILLHLDERGISVGTGSACNSETLEPSHVLTALGNPYEYVHGSIRFTLGKHTKDSDVDYVLKILPAVVRELRLISPLNLNMKSKKTMSEPKAFTGGNTPHFLRKK